MTLSCRYDLSSALFQSPRMLCALAAPIKLIKANQILRFVNHSAFFPWKYAGSQGTIKRVDKVASPFAHQNSLAISLCFSIMDYNY